MTMEPMAGTATGHHPHAEQFGSFFSSTSPSAVPTCTRTAGARCSVPPTDETDGDTAPCRALVDPAPRSGAPSDARHVRARPVSPSAAMPPPVPPDHHQRPSPFKPETQLNRMSEWSLMARNRAPSLPALMAIDRRRKILTRFGLDLAACFL